MRNLTDKEQKRFIDKGCLFCGQDSFDEGPSGGICTNIFCSNEDCRAGYNVNPIGMTFQLIKEPKTVYPNSLIDTVKEFFKFYFE